MPDNDAKDMQQIIQDRVNSGMMAKGREDLIARIKQLEFRINLGERLVREIRDELMELKDILGNWTTDE